MKNLRFDADNQPRCWNCGSKSFNQKRTFRSKVIGLGVGSLATKQKMKCQRCGKYNDPGNGRPYRGPSAHRYRKEWEAEQARRGIA